LAGVAETSILVIKLGALGDFVQALGPLAAVRGHHPEARIVLLTTVPFVAFAEASPYVDEVWVDERPKLLDVRGWLSLRRRLRGGRFTRAYDLQTSDRTGFYFRLFWPGPYPEWVGIARGCSHPHANPHRDFMHNSDSRAEQLRMAGIAHCPPPDLSWAEGDALPPGLGSRYALLAPGGAPHRPAKRWPAERYAALAVDLAARGIQPVLIGAASEEALHEAIRARCPEAIGLAGKTTLIDLAALARGAVVAVGNDTGPMHLAAASGCPSVVLYSHESDPALCGQRGARVAWIRRPSLNDVGVDDVVDAIAALMAADTGFEAVGPSANAALPGISNSPLDYISRRSNLRGSHDPI
jgi:ADP-heptose:LPS heptosyltransferase